MCVRDVDAGQPGTTPQNSNTSDTGTQDVNDVRPCSCQCHKPNNDIDQTDTIRSTNETKDSLDSRTDRETCFVDITSAGAGDGLNMIERACK